MYLKSRVKLPDVHGKLTRLRRGDITYIKYEYDRYYDPEKKYTYPQRATIGKVCPDDDTMMIPNEAFLKYFPDAVLSGMEDRTERSSCLRVGTYAVMHKIVLDYSLDKLLGQFFSERDMALLLDLASYSIVEESDVAQHYPDYAYNHPLYSSGMKIYSDASVSDFVFEDMSERILQSSITQRLLSFPNVVMTSHQGFFTKEALTNIAETTLENAKAFMDGNVLKNEVLS